MRARASVERRRRETRETRAAAREEKRVCHTYLSRFAPSVTRVVICVSRALCPTDKEKRETALSLREDNVQYFLVVLLINFIILSCQTMWLHYKIEYTTLNVDETDEILNGDQSNES